MKQFFITALLFTILVTPALAARLIPATPSTDTSGTNTSQTTAPAPAPQPVRPTITPAPAATAPAPVRPAQTAAPAPARTAQAAEKNSAFYMGAQVGDSTIGAFLGYQLSKMYAMEIAYDYVDPIKQPNTTIEKSRIGMSGLALFPVKFSELGPMAIYIKVGYGRTTEKTTVTDPGIPGFIAPSTTVTTKLATGVTGGAGVQVDLSTNSTARLGVNYVGGDRSVYLAAMYKF